MQSFKFTFFIFLINFNFLNAKTLGLHEASVLFPLPQPQHWNSLLNTTDHEFLLPKNLFDQIPFFINQHNDRTYPLLHVVGVRFDPCFTEGEPPFKCQAQVRLVWQPLKEQNSKTQTVDASLHTFFHFSQDEFTQLIRLLRQISNSQLKTSSLPLGVHPLIQQQGLDGEFSSQLKNLLISQLRSKPIERITFMKLKGIDDIWIFGGLNKMGEKYEAQEIPQTGKSVQQDFINSMAMRPHPTQFLGGIFPPPHPENTLDLLTRDSINSNDFTEEDIASLVKDMTDLEHPQRHNPGTADCVSCHLANTVRAYTFREFSQFNLEHVYAENRYKNNLYNLENISKKQGQTNILRMFGYFEDEPMISQRTINETAEAVSLIQLIE
jgi:hypothetical protein